MLILARPRQVYVPLRRGALENVDLLRAVSLRAQRPPPLGARQTSVLGVRLHVRQREAAQVAPHRVLHLRGSPQHTHRGPGSTPSHRHRPAGRVQERQGPLAELGRVDVRDPLAPVYTFTHELGVAPVVAHAVLPEIEKGRRRASLSPVGDRAYPHGVRELTLRHQAADGGGPEDDTDVELAADSVRRAEWFPDVFLLLFLLCGYVVGDTQGLFGVYWLSALLGTLYLLAVG